MAIFHQHKCIFIHLPRTGGTTIHNALGGGPKNHFPWHKFKSDPEYNEVWDSYLKFATVRNPFDWLVSLYNHPNTLSRSQHRSQSHCPERGDHVNIAQVMTPTGPVKKRSFEDYVRCPAMFSWESPYVTQSQTIGYDIDFFIKFEKLQQGFDKLCDKIGRSRSILKVVVPTANRKKDYKKYYDSDLIRDVSKVFRKDLTRFRYSFSDESLWHTLSHKHNYYND